MVALTREGNNKAFEEIVDRYKGKIERIIYGMLGNNQDTEDVGQEVFIRFYYSINQFKGESELLTYLTRIAINLSINELRRRKRKVFNLKKYLKEVEISNEPNFLKRIEISEFIDKAIMNLTPKLRSVVVLRFLNSYTIDEISDTLKIPEGTVRSRLCRAQEKLLKVIKPMLEK